MRNVTFITRLSCLCRIYLDLHSKTYFTTDWLLIFYLGRMHMGLNGAG